MWLWGGALGQKGTPSFIPDPGGLRKHLLPEVLHLLVRQGPRGTGRKLLHQEGTGISGIKALSVSASSASQTTGTALRGILRVWRALKVGA